MEFLNNFIFKQEIKKKFNSQNDFDESTFEMFKKSCGIKTGEYKI